METKVRKKMYKKGKFWVVATITTAMLTGIGLSSVQADEANSTQVLQNWLKEVRFKKIQLLHHQQQKIRLRLKFQKHHQQIPQLLLLRTLIKQLKGDNR